MTLLNQMNDLRTLELIDDLRKLPAETPYVEFKENNADPQMIGKLIAALSNAARLADQHTAYMVWGIRDGDHAVVGTTFEPSRERVQNQGLEIWLSQCLRPAPVFEFKQISYQNQKLILLEIPAASNSPVEFDRTAYIRIGDATPKLSEYPERMKALWAKLQPYAWEAGIAKSFVDGDGVLAALDYSRYFDLTKQPLPDNRKGIFEKLIADQLIQPDVGERWNITNLGAILFAKRLSDFSVSIARKGVRFVRYAGTSRANAVSHRADFHDGYACSFEGIVQYLGGLVPRNEEIGRVFREEHPLYPDIAIRELIANALIHQDMTITGAGPLIELFTDRLEISNPGEPLVSPERFLDLPPRSRNEALSSLMRRMKICEEQGTGVDKVLAAIEFFQLPPPDFRFEQQSVRVVLFAAKRFADMSADERIRACYWHAALQYVSGKRMKNASLCERFGIDSQNASQASQVIKLALKAQRIRAADPEHPRAGYVPHWA